MRPKFVITLGLLTFLAFGAVLLLKRQMDKSSAPPIAVNVTPSVPAPSPAVAPAARPAVSNIVIVANEAQPSTPAAAPAALPATATASTNVALSEEERDAEIDRLQDWSTKDDAGSLSNIVADLTSPDKDIRQAAIEATVQFGSMDAIPFLKAAAASTDDLDAQIDYLQAVKFLSYPPMQFTPTTPEQAAQLQAQMLANSPPRSQPDGSVQNPQAVPEQNPPGNSNP
jgi:hypothetical protein